MILPWIFFSVFLARESSISHDNISPLLLFVDFCHRWNSLLFSDWVFLSFHFYFQCPRFLLHTDASHAVFLLENLQSRGIYNQGDQSRLPNDEGLEDARLKVRPQCMTINNFLSMKNQLYRKTESKRKTLPILNLFNYCSTCVLIWLRFKIMKKMENIISRSDRKNCCPGSVSLDLSLFLDALLFLKLGCARQHQSFNKLVGKRFPHYCFPHVFPKKKLAQLRKILLSFRKNEWQNLRILNILKIKFSRRSMVEIHNDYSFASSVIKRKTWKIVDILQVDSKFLASSYLFEILYNYPSFRSPNFHDTTNKPANYTNRETS